MSLHHKRDPDKARRYINDLDIARCLNRWVDVPELVRKVAKHAPQRKCLVLTASSECKVATTDPRSSSASTRSNSRAELKPPLREMLQGEIPFYQDGLQAKICLAWIHWSLSEPEMALSVLPKDFGVVLQELARNAREPYGWTEICVVKGVYMKAAAQEQVVGKHEALETFRSIMSWLLERAAKPSTSPQQLFWEQQVLVRAATLASREMTPSRENISFALTAFRLWAKLGAMKHEFTPIGNDNAGGGHFIPSAQTWKAYYDYVSRVVQQGLPYPPSASLIAQVQKSDTKTKLPLRAQQVAELRRCESVYEATFLNSIRFPKASESNEEVEEWVEQVIRNWKTLCGPEWHEEELGEDGRNAVGRIVLDILYRAASKTFHSTLILRRLFQVHASLTDFDLALKAFASYNEIMNMGRSRVAEPGMSQTALDNDAIYLNTVGESILLLCQYGGLKEAEKAREYCDLLGKELARYSEPSQELVVNGDTVENDVTNIPRKDQISKDAFALAYRNIGIGLANWARWTPVNESRSEIQAKAVSSLKKSLKFNEGEIADLEAVFALGLLLAETRELTSAIAVVKEALASYTPVSPPPKNSRFGVGAHKSYQRERHLIPLWHLLSLLLSARQDFDTAVRSCEAAFEQFPSPAVLFGPRKPVMASMNGEDEKLVLPPFHSRPEQQHGVIDDMESMERERILEIRMTELALTEVLEGPDVAVNSSNELLSLFLRLFGDLGIDMEDLGPLPKIEAESPVPPKSSSGGTLKSFKGSLFGRKKVSRGSILRGSEVPNNAASAAAFSEKQDAMDNPTIQVTDEHDRNQAQNRSVQNIHKLHRREGSLTKRMRRHSEERNSRTTSRPASSYLPSSRQHSASGQEEGMPIRDSSHPRPHTYDGTPPMLPPDQVGLAVTADTPPALPSPTSVNHDGSTKAKQRLPQMSHNVPHTAAPPPIGHSRQPPEQDVRLPTVQPYSSSTQPRPHFPKAQALQHALGILVKVWLLIAGLYRRAAMFEDAREACEEASKHAFRVESLVAVQESSARSFANKGWGGGKSSDELWADVFAERGYLLLAESSPHAALDLFEQAVGYSPDHVKATIGLSNILLDISDQTIPPEPPRPTISTGLSSLSLAHSTPLPVLTKISTTASANKILSVTPTLNRQTTAASALDPTPQISISSLKTVINPAPNTSDENRKTPSSLNRIAARDRAYGLLSQLTKLGGGWDCSEAWLALARAYEMGGEVERAKECLWWVVELEDGRPVRGWRVLGGGYVL